ncbi:MAG: alpha/beta hydrolase [Bacteroidota bacterium]
MKAPHMHKLIGLLTLGIVISLSSCKKDNTASSHSESALQGTTFWECELLKVNPDTTMHFYLITLSLDGKQLTGEVVVRDSAEQEPGIITGVIEQDSVIFTADFGNNILDFTFRGVVVDDADRHILEGSVKPVLPQAGGNDGQIIVVSSSLDFRCPDVFPDNPSVFRKVSSSEHPNDSAVIFIHGMTGDLTHWNKVIEQLTADFKKRHDVYVYQYNWKDSIMKNGRILLDSVQAAGLTNPIIVAHSMGGLVARAYIAKGGPVATLVALGTPHLGSPLATLTKLLCFINFPGPKDMAPESVCIKSLLASTNDAQNRNRYVVFAGQMKGSFKIVNRRLKWVWAEDYYDIMDKVGFDAFVLFKSPPNDGLVPLSSGLFEGYPVKERKPILEWVDHKNLRNPVVSTEVMNYINAL